MATQTGYLGDRSGPRGSGPKIGAKAVMLLSDKLLRKLQEIVLISCTLAILVYLWWQFRPYHIIEIHSIKITTPVVRLGEDVGFITEYNKNPDFKDTKALVFVSFADGVYLPSATPTASPLPVGEHAFLEYRPAPRVPGKYHLEIQRVYWPNPVRKIIYENKSDDFEVVAPVPVSSADVERLTAELDHEHQLRAEEHRLRVIEEEKLKQLLFQNKKLIEKTQKLLPPPSHP